MGRTLDFAKSAFGDVTNDGVLPELCSGKQRKLVAHLEEPSKMSSSCSLVVGVSPSVVKKEFIVVLADGSGKLRTLSGSCPQII